MITLSSSVIAQKKSIFGDTLYFNQQYQCFLKSLELKDFYTSQDDFNYRFHSPGQIIEITNNNDSLFGILTNFIFKYELDKNIPSDTIFNKINLSENEVSAVLNIIFNSEVLKLTSEDSINNWCSGLFIRFRTHLLINQTDSTIINFSRTSNPVYRIEYSNLNEYWIRTYCNLLKDSIPELLSVFNLAASLSDTLNLFVRYNDLLGSIPVEEACYSQDGRVVNCYVNTFRNISVLANSFISYKCINYYSIGVFSSLRLPYGYHLKFNRKRLHYGKFPMTLSVSHQLDLKGQYNFETAILTELRYNRGQLGYSYRIRKHMKEDLFISFSNQKVFYGYKNRKQIFVILGGVDFLNSTTNKTGALIGFNSWIPILRVRFDSSASFFHNHTDYKFGISKPFFFKYNSSNRFKNYRELNIGIDYVYIMGLSDLKLSATFTF
jgi:hypothetical protein